MNEAIGLNMQSSWSTGADWLSAELRRVGEAVPRRDSYAGVDEINARLVAVASRHPQVARLRKVGNSRDGEALLCLEIEGGEEKRALVTGGPHPNEPVGGLTAVHLAETLCADEELRSSLAHSWHIVGCIDPDGARLNQGWLMRPYDRLHYARHFYRPAFIDQVEWTFPLRHKALHFDAALPETQAWMRLIDELRPTLLASLHNAEASGVFYHLSRPLPNLYPLLDDVPSWWGLALDAGVPEEPGAPLYAPGVFGRWDAADVYDHEEQLGLDAATWPAGDSSSAYAQHHGTTTLVVEVPCWSDARFSNTSPSGLQYPDVARTSDKAADAALNYLSDVLSITHDYLDTSSPYYRACTEALATHAPASPQGTYEGEPCEDHVATVAEAASLRESVHLLRLRYGGMLLRLLDSQTHRSPLPSEAARAHKELAERFAPWGHHAMAETPAPVPVQHTVATQASAVLAAAWAIANRDKLE
ncbi:M14 family zinc carboxypeptidase [Streptomyces kronopolitis]|uniref:M14 family zinc carboxypeptidase n=1 Tax=Streptomyces kronopolitis TaxID=1612435 RepID=UPI003448A944